MFALVLAAVAILAIALIVCFGGALVAVACVGLGALSSSAGGRAPRGARGGAPPLPPELDGLPDDIREKVVLNYEPRGLQANPEFLPAVGDPPALREIDRAISAGCVREPSLYAQSRPGTVDGYAVRIFPKGWHIYKTFLGFVTEEQVKEYTAKNPDRPSWCGDQYLTYAIARTDWGTIVSFRLEADLVLLDFFDVSNLERLVAEIKELAAEFPPSLPAEKAIRVLRLSTGFGLEPADHLRTLAETYPTWPSIWYYTEPALPRNTPTHCGPRYIEGLNPIGAFKGVHTADLAVFQVVFARHPAIDGLVREAIRSRFDEAGAFYHEEYLVKGSALASKLRFDRDDPVCWTNWRFEGFTPPEGGLRLQHSVMKFASSSRRAPNHGFALAKFYSMNGAPLRDLPRAGALPRRPHILAYNVHGFVSLDADAPVSKTRGGVGALLKRYAPAVEYVVLTEAPAGGQKLRELLAGYPHWLSARNGARDRSAAVVVAAKRPLVGVEIIATDGGDRSSPYWVHREQILFKTSGGLRGVALHLEIGSRYFAGVAGAEDGNRARRAENAALRTKQLETILARRPDFLVGDFNFTLDDPERSFLEGRGYVPANGGRDNSTPYNRVDHFFVREGLAGGLAPGDNVLLRCNYSDHLPMLQALPRGPQNAGAADRPHTE
jgi:hypothetical protein